MYIAIEGIKGSGKSTVLNQLKLSGHAGLQGTCCFPITAPMPASHPMELQYRYCAELQNDDDFAEKLFIKRAYWNQPRENDGAIIGDRSIATAIVTRWRKWDDPFYTIAKIQEDYKYIMRPEVIIFMDTPVDRAVQHIARRAPKITGRKEELPAQLSQAAAVYKELFQDGVYQRFMGKTELIRLPFSSSITDLQHEISSIIQFYNQ